MSDTLTDLHALGDDLAGVLDRLESLRDQARAIVAELTPETPDPKPDPDTYTDTRYAVTMTAPYLTTEHGRHILAAWCEGTVNGIEVRGTVSIYVSRPYDHGTDTYGAPILAGNAYGVKRREPYGDASDAARRTLAAVAVEHATRHGWTCERIEHEGRAAHARDRVRKVAYGMAEPHESERDPFWARRDLPKIIAGEVDPR